MLMSGKTALVTGAAAGIGRAIALTFAREGARVMVSDIDAAGTEETAAMIRGLDGEAQAMACDVADPGQVDALVAATVDAFGGLDAAVNNAGIEGEIALLADQTLENYDRVMGVNARGAFLCLRAEIPAMLASGGGAIVNISSVAGLVGFPGLSPYVATKHALAGMTKNVALEYGKQGIRANAICPGGIDTRMLDEVAAKSTGGAQTSAEFLGPLHPIGRIGTVDEVAGLAVWLCSAQAGFVTGAIIPVDGGFTAQ